MIDPFKIFRNAEPLRLNEIPKVTEDRCPAQ